MEKTMSKKLIKPVSFAVGAAFATTLAAGSVSAGTDANPFAVNELSGGYMQLAYGGGESKGKDKEGDGAGKYGAEGKCGGEKTKKEGKCGEGKCGSDMKKNMEGKCGGEKAEKEGKCGEGKCGSSK
jgi:uncharacterized low-complexity protein